MKDLDELFTRQRRSESAWVPSFAATLARAEQQGRHRVARRGLWLYGAASAVAVVGLLAITWRSLERTPDIAWSQPLGVQLTEVTWTSPTDFLLATPDRDALHGMPRLVQVRDLTPVLKAPVPDTND